ncbi:molecular chaperone DnaK [Amycolatopsis sp. H20-H5]|uniref:molecular chaperone DnaK n=1 Tax=Amycolatopsis sp. H20-H5 TaxID=3046309 RepID=UPI002DBC2453|nr:molecular chaperone DnaK [Amycolatopsis sp. H20-H5]MEC3977355.1 molecular chaperone DnaK [Amycolatopsis sp. H20-H5]
MPPLPYVLGIDLAPSRTSAATSGKHSDGWDAPEPVLLGARGPSTASALFLDDEGYLLTGDAARQAGAGAPARLVTGFHQRVGDDVPLVVAGERFSPESLSTVLVEAIAEQAAEHLGGAAGHLVLTHPGSWGGYRRELLRQALADTGLTALTLIPAPIAALHAHLPLPGPGDTFAGVCEYGPDGVSVTLAASASGGWQPRLSAEGVDPAAAVGTLFELAHTASVPPNALAGVVFCGEVEPAALPPRLPCPVFAGPEPVLTAALGAAILARRTRVPVETTLLPRVSAVPELTERPPRPPVEVTPFVLPEKVSTLKRLGKRRPLAAAAAVVAVAATVGFFTLNNHEATAVKPTPPSSCTPAPGSTPSLEGHC